MKKTWVSLRSIKQHEFRTTLRYIKVAGATWHDIYIQLGKLQTEAISKLIKGCTGIFVYYLLLSSLGDASNVSISVQGITASVPTAFVTVVASVGFFFIILQMQSALMIVLLRAHEGARLSLRGFSMGAYGLYNGQDEMELSTPLIRYGSFKEVLPASGTLIVLYLIVLASLLVPLAGLWVYLLDLQMIIARSDIVHGVYRLVAVFGVFVLIASAIYTVIFNIPLPIKKNSFSIRWGFLTRLHPPGRHPRLEAWLEEE
ncbi:hypothetical protein [Cognatiyoonia sp. IB215182]|uniref:hypothetical protein n=1 Tax=Cognatiyoonia sp. IB215182 TaxID=3097353 RepID=UPI002A11D620|nr:hypothetical protein [Cognatiyoonia sp. IB215182]MDX8353700.1 hypothetical protein [Cognatiyoonia sp. IB215182]